MFLKDLGYRAKTIKTAIDAKKWLSSNRPILMLIDIMLPDVSGLEFCRWLNSQKDLKDIPVIHMAAFLTDEITQEDSLLSGARDFITKPFNLEVLEQKIKALI